MPVEPMNPTVMQTYRDTLSVSSAPSFIDSSEKIIPVAVVAGAISVTSTATPTFPAPSTGQTQVTYSTGTAGLAVVAGTGVNMRTVTATKTLYVTQFCIAVSVGGAIEINDGGAAGTNKICAYAYTGSTLVLNFPTGVPFSTNCHLDVASGATCYFSMQGFEQ